MRRNDPASSQPSTRVSLGRRRLLAAGAAVGATALAGCSAALDFLAGYVLQDVNVFNGTDRRIGGSITVTGPGGDQLLDEEFDLAPEEEAESDGSDEESGSEGADDENASMAPYEDVFTEAGEYEVSVELADGETIDGQSANEGTVSVETPDEDHVVVLLGTGESSEADPIEITVIQELSDLEEYDSESES